MDWKDKEYIKRTSKLSYDTMLLIAQADTKEEILEAVDIVMESTSEDEIIKALNVMYMKREQKESIV